MKYLVEFSQEEYCDLLYLLSTLANISRDHGFEAGDFYKRVLEDQVIPVYTTQELLAMEDHPTLPCYELTTYGDYMRLTE